MPEEVQKAVDTRASMQILGANYMQYQTGQAMRDAAANPAGSAAGVGVGVGAGIGMGYQMIGAMQQPSTPPVQAAAAPGLACPKCGTINPAGAKFCSSCGSKLIIDMTTCPKCGKQVPMGKFCPECGAPLGSKKCSKCGTDVPASAKFCSECGKEQ